MTKLSDLISTGNAATEAHRRGARGWFIGHFIDPTQKLRCTEDVEVKWGEHLSGERKQIPISNKKSRTLTLLVKGSFSIEFPSSNTSVTLRRAGDYVVFAAGVPHSWEAVEDSIVLTVRWPSIPGDQKQISL